MQNKKIYILSVLLCLSLCGCGVIFVSDSEYEKLSLEETSSYFNNYQSGLEGQVCTASGQVYQSANKENAVIAWLNATEDSTLYITGYIRPLRGNVQLVYTAQDGTATLLSEKDGTLTTEEIAVTAGTGTIHFTGNGEKGVCGFRLEIRAGDGISLKNRP